MGQIFGANQGKKTGLVGKTKGVGRSGGGMGAPPPSQTPTPGVIAAGSPREKKTNNVTIENRDDRTHKDREQRVGKNGIGAGGPHVLHR